MTLMLAREQAEEWNDRCASVREGRSSFRPDVTLSSSNMSDEEVISELALPPSQVQYLYNVDGIGKVR